MRGRTEFVRLACLVGLGLVILGYQAVATSFYRSFRVPQGNGMNFLLLEELAHAALYLLFGLATAALTFVALRGLPLCERLGEAVRALCAHRLAPLVAFAAVVCACLGLATLVLGHAVTTDDEHTYRFIARTLRTGAAVAPSPRTDLPFYAEQFVVLTEQVRFGKYPIGHPLLLALGQALRVEALVVPLLAALAVFPLYRVGRRLFDRRVAGLACVLYALSPQVWFTGATYLSQPASALALLCALALLVGTDRDHPPSALALGGAGALLGYGVLVRPLPGVLFVAVAVADALFAAGPVLSTRIRRALAVAVPAAAVASVILVVNALQTGAPLVSGYEAFHAPGEGIGAVMRGGFDMMTMSVAAALLRANFWLLGWPVSLAACCFAGRLPRPWLLWGILGAELAYRVAAPKAGVGGAGPLYVFEAVGLLCLLSASGLARIARGETWLTRAGLPRPALMPAVIGLGVAALALFLPPKLADLSRMGAGQLEVARQAARRGVHHAVIFHEGTVPPFTGLSWAYFPPCNGPRLDDDVLFFRLQRNAGLAENLEFWQRRYPDRSAWYFGWDPKTGPTLTPLEEYVGIQASALALAASP
jgi:hypothetical protein